MGCHVAKPAAHPHQVGTDKFWISKIALVFEIAFSIPIFARFLIECRIFEQPQSNDA